MNRKMRGRGMASSWYGIARTATIDRAGAWAELDDGGTAKIVTGVTEIGEGILTVLAQIAAEELGVRPEDVTIGDNDTSRSPEAAHAGATRQTYMIGNSVALASREARAELFREIADHWDVPVDSLRAFDRELWAQDTNLRMSMEEAVKTCKARGVVPVGSASFTAHGTGLDPVDGSGSRVSGPTSLGGAPSPARAYPNGKEERRPSTRPTICWRPNDGPWTRHLSP